MRRVCIVVLALVSAVLTAGGAHDTPAREVVIEATHLNPPALTVMMEQRVTFVTRTGRVAHVGFIGDAEQHQFTNMGSVSEGRGGTGTLTLMIKEACPRAEVIGLDVDPVVLALARNKLRRGGVDVPLFEGSVTAAPFETASFDRVLSRGVRG